MTPENECRLSRLQWFILLHAARRENLAYPHILEHYFGWKPTGVAGSHRFSRKKLGETNYRKVMASLSRSCRRLEDRGLVLRVLDQDTHTSAVRLTERARLLIGNRSHEPDLLATTASNGQG